MQIRSKTNLWFRYLLCSLSPALAVKLLYYYYFHKKLNLKQPVTLDEKIQWMKLYYYKDNPLVYQCADKYRVREYVRECGLEHILNELTATYKSPEDINWDVLPDRFVLKWNFGCGGNVICFDKKQIDKAKAMKELKEFQKIKAHLICAEPQYKMEKLLLCERFIESEDGAAPTDYKFYCFNGEAKYVLCCYNRSETRKPAFYFFDKNWQLQRFNQMGKDAPDNFTMPKPDGIDEAFRCAEILSKPFPFVRADFYIENGKVYFGELTFTPGGGFDLGRLPATQKLFGDMLTLPQKK
ncbi:MAG: hypothetical protein K6F29_02780 [Bacteroidales bacterium]|nr:hypothetical protein [Bacteroidales bacterium]